MNVRSKLSLATGFGLLALLLVFYLGGRVIVVRTFRQAESEVLHAVPGLRRTINLELEQLSHEASILAASSAIGALPAGPDAPRIAADIETQALRDLGLHLCALANPDGRILAARLRPRTSDEPHEPHASIGRHFEPGARFLEVTNPAAPEVSGLIMLDEGAMLVVARAVPGTGTAHAVRGILLVGRYFEDKGVLSRVTAVLPTLGPATRQVELYPSPRSDAASIPAAAQSREILRESVEIAGMGPWSSREALEARMPLYDIYGRPAFSLVVRLPHTFTGLAELALAWLTLLVAAMGALFIVPIFAVQGRTVLNPLSKLVTALRDFETGDVRGRRLGWRRRDEFGVVAGAVDRMLDAVERVTVQAQESEQRTRALLEANPDRILVVDRNGRICDAVRATATAALGAGEPATLTPEASERIQALSAEVIDRGVMRVVEFSHAQADGTLFWGEARMVRMGASRALVMVRDISEQRAARAAHERLDEKMVQVQKFESLGVLAGGIAHDFSKLFALILGNTEQALRAMPERALARTELENTRDAALRAATLTRQILAYAGQGSMRLERTDINRILSDVSQLVMTSLASQAKLALDLQTPLPYIEADLGQIWQVAMNLLANASESLEGKPGAIHVSTRHLQASAAMLAEYISPTPLPAGDYVLLEIRDTGCGMDERMRERLFDPFFTTKQVGRGLGLSSVLGIVRAHRGGIAVASEVGVGSCVRVVLPALKSTDGAPCEASSASAGAASAAAPSPTRGLVLLAEDEPDIRRLIAIILKGLGHELLLACTGREAVELFTARQAEVCMVLMDVEMPEVNGREALRAIQALRPDVPVVAMSGYGATVTRERLSGVRLDALLIKPFTYDELMRTMSAIGLGREAPV